MDTKITFFSSRTPRLTAGQYSVTATQTLKNGSGDLTTYQAKKLEFYVDGPKFELEPGMVHQVYPVDGVRGCFIADVPSIALNRITLPWERERRNKASGDDSWLMLFMVNEEEARELEEGSGIAREVFGSGIDARYSDSNVNYLKIPGKLKSLFPQEAEYQYLSYCRKMGEEEEKAIILGNRLPAPDSKNTVYLLSLEQVKTEADAETYPYLHKWEFYCTNALNYFIPAGSKHGETPFPDSITDRLFKDTDDFKATLQQSNIKLSDQEIKRYEQDGGSFHGRLLMLKGKLSSFNYPVANASAFVKQGAVVLKEAAGHKWYRGPLQAAPVALLLNSENNQEWTGVKKYYRKERESYSIPNDRTYQVAFELGVLTALKDEAFHKPYFEWKQEVCTALLMAENAGSGQSVNHLQVNLKVSTEKPVPVTVKQKVEDWKKLSGIPYSYLIPSEKMLPSESIRTFCIDCNWVNAFLLGAFSIGNTYDRIENDFFNILDKDNLFLKETRCGFLIHSLVVSGWPDYAVIYDMGNYPYYNALTNISRKKLSKNIDIFVYNYISDKSTHRITFHLPAGKTHSGFRYDNGAFKKQYGVSDLIVPFRNTENQAPIPSIPEKRILDIAGLAGSKTPAEFGKMLLEKSPEVQFEWNSMAN